MLCVYLRPRALKVFIVSIQHLTAQQKDTGASIGLFSCFRCAADNPDCPHDL